MTMQLDCLTVDEFLQDENIQTQLHRLFNRATPAQQERMQKLFTRKRTQRIPETAREPVLQGVWQYLQNEPMRSKLFSLVVNAHERDINELPLARGLETINDQFHGLECAQRFALLYVRMELRTRACSTSLGRQKAASAALQSIADELHGIDKPVSKVKSWQKSARAFEQIWELRPGLLLLLSRGVNYTFEKGLSKSCVATYVKCIETQMPSLWEKSAHLYDVALRLFDEGLVAYGRKPDFHRQATEQTVAMPQLIQAKETGLHVEGSGLGFQIQIFTNNKVSDTAQSILFAINGNVDGLIHLFNQGLASPRDVSCSREFSLVRWALYGGVHDFKTVQFLLDQGAVVDNETYEHFWDFVYRGKCSPVELQELRCIIWNPPSAYRDTNWQEVQNFPLIHQMILGQSPGSLLVEIAANNRAIYEKDALGRTALDWAVASANQSLSEILIDSGSPLDTIDADGRSTVLHAVDSHNCDVLRMLLEAGANPNSPVLNHSSPLIAACFGGLTSMVQLLIEFGANIEEYNPEGWTALQAVAVINNAKSATECARILLDGGANPGHVSSNGSSPLERVISYNNHMVLKLFMERYETVQCFERLNLLPVIATFADMTTISILKSSGLLRHIWSDKDAFGDNERRLHSRVDYSDELALVFHELCNS